MLHKLKANEIEQQVYFLLNVPRRRFRNLFLVMNASYLFKNISSSLGFQFLIQLTIFYFLFPLTKRNHIMSQKLETITQIKILFTLTI
jgi:hypothetical protein